MIDSAPNPTEGNSMSMATMIAPDEPSVIDLGFTAHDRCDRCGAQAYIEATKGESTLIFCGHHGTAHKSALIEAGFIVRTDDTLKTLK